MKNKLLIFMFLILIPLMGFSQLNKYIYLVDKVCNEINPDKIKELSPEKIQIELMKLGDKVRKENQDEVNELINELRNKYPNWSDNKLLKEYFKNFMFLAIDRCPVYFELMLIPLGNCPKENNSLILIKQEAEKFINNNSAKSSIELNDLVIQHIITIVFDNKELIEKDYKDGIANPQFMKDMNSYLFHRSKDYMKLVLSVQIDKMLDKQ